MFVSLSLGVALVRPYAGRKKLKSISRKKFYLDTNKFRFEKEEFKTIHKRPFFLKKLQYEK